MRVNVYIRKTDELLWKELEKPSEWIHQKLNEKEGVSIHPTHIQDEVGVEDERVPNHWPRLHLANPAVDPWDDEDYALRKNPDSPSGISYLEGGTPVHMSKQEYTNWRKWKASLKHDQER